MNIERKKCEPAFIAKVGEKVLGEFEYQYIDLEDLNVFIVIVKPKRMNYGMHL